MCRRTRGLFLLLFAVRLIAVALEARFLRRYQQLLESGRLPFDPATCMGRMAAADESFAQGQIKACIARRAHVVGEAKGLVLCMCAAVAVLSTRVRKGMAGLCARLKIPSPEAVLLILLVSVTTAAEKVYGRRLTLVEDTYSSRHMKHPLGIVVLFGIEIPLVLCLMMRLFRFLRRKFVVAVYAALVANSLLHTFWGTGVDRDALVKVSPEIFPEGLQRALRAQGLSESIYRQRAAKGRRNASLVGVGKEQRIEIQGDFDGGLDELYPIIFHEVGHAVDNIIVKRKMLAQAIMACEALAFGVVYMRGSKAFGAMDMSSEAFAMMAFVIYLVAGRDLVLVLSNLYAQRSELFADDFARANGYGLGLSQDLFKMAVEHNATVDTTPLFNAIASLHPSIRERIDRCGCQAL